MFYVSLLRRYILDPSHVIDYRLLEVQPNLSYKEVSLRILDQKEQVLRNKIIPYVKVLWYNFNSEEVIWEAETAMR